MSIRCGHCRGRHDTASLVKACFMGAKPVRQTPATEGVYLLNGTVYKVKLALHGSGRLYPLRLAGSSWELEPGMARQLTQADRMTVEQAREYGALYGRCVVCQTVLTNEKSIKEGVGPVCKSRL